VGLNLKDAAEQILFGNRLEDKLISLNDLVFQTEVPPLIDIPNFPGRPDFLQPKKEKSSHFPGLHELDHDVKRGEVLHFFANHELLAIELMAYALLKFPEAPESFQKGIVKTIQEEQKHMNLYRMRMKELGVSLGDISVNSYFWDSMKNIKSPLDYVVQMCLTFEQANLDYSLQYHNNFTQMGDVASASIMKEVLEDEIGHVGLGVVWLNRWKSEGETEWQAYQRLLPYPITPARGKGKIYFDFLRSKAGLSQEFIEEMRLFSFSKGRVPFVLFYNPDCESDCAVKGQYTKTAIFKQMEDDLGLVMTHFSVASDIVALKRIPSKNFLKYFQSIGVHLPQYIEVKDWADLPKQIASRKIKGFLPWGWSPRIQALEKKCNNISKDASYCPNIAEPAFQSKFTSLELLKEFAKAQNIEKDYPEWGGEVCVNYEEVEKAILKLRESVGNNVVIRSEFGLAGQGMVRHFEPEIKPNNKNWCLQTLTSERLMVEPWLNRVADCSCLIDIRDGKIKRVGITRMLTSFQGQYLGTVTGKPGSIFPEEITEILYNKINGKQGAIDLLWQFAEYAGERFIANGYNGPLCIDAFFYRLHDEIRLRPCVEINARFSMGRLALELTKKVMTGKIGLFLLSGKNDLKKAGFENFSLLISTLQKKYPLVMSQGEIPLWTNGLVAISDPEIAKIITAIFYVGENLEQCQKVFEDLRGQNW